MRYVPILMAAALMLSSPVYAQFWPDWSTPSSKPATPAKPAPKTSKPATKPEKSETETVPESTDHVELSDIQDPFIVLFSDKGEVVGCRQVRGTVRFLDLPRRPLTFEQVCERTERVGLVDRCTREVFREVGDGGQTFGTKIGFWDRTTNTYQVWSGNALIMSKKAKTDYKGPGC